MATWALQEQDGVAVAPPCRGRAALAVPTKVIGHAPSRLEEGSRFIRGTGGAEAAAFPHRRICPAGSWIGLV
ncbi:MAG: hypothetical protein PUB57_08270 [Selenomonadaceae bacterium]|nr:hypothetical protein [Selenomonadaceae bacterium]